MSTQLNFGRDINGFNAFAPVPSTNKYGATITNGNATSITVPSNFKNWIAAFCYQPGTNVWVDFTGATAVVPANGTLTAITSELLPGSRSVTAGSVISVVTNNTSCDVGILLYAIS